MEGNIQSAFVATGFLFSGYEAGTTGVWRGKSSTGSYFLPGGDLAGDDCKGRMGLWGFDGFQLLVSFPVPGLEFM